MSRFAWPATFENGFSSTVPAPSPLSPIPLHITFTCASHARNVSRSHRPWNYPYIISLAPLVGAIAAGCPVVLKPSEHTPAVSSLYAELFAKYLDQDAYAVVNGAISETALLLDLKWGELSNLRVAGTLEMGERPSRIRDDSARNLD